MELTEGQEESRYSSNTQLIGQAQAGDEEALERLVLQNMGLVRSLALRFRDRGTEMEDLIQIGTIGMIKAIRSFDLSRGTAFSTYAVPLIVGEIRRHLRDDGMIKISRTYRRIGVALMNAQSRIQSEEGRDPTIGELAELCGISPEEAAIALDAIAPVSSLSETVYGEEGITLEGTIADEDNDIEKLSDKIALNQAIARMQPLWQKIVLLRYYRDLTQQQTADRLGLSQVKVSREEKKIMAFLREQLAN
ncbi:MAG: sigma-70 family RNA polymerase sigma factor [Clostridia bacterium]|nr:sigma-70 family RNA polymerase sigma factor [Clostridia bacterium]